MEITRTTHEQITVLSVQGQLDAITAPALERELQTLSETGTDRFIVDLGGVQLISSAALRVLLSAAKFTKKQQGQILLCALTPEVKKVFELSGLTNLFNLQPTLADALASLGVTDAPPAPPAAETPPPPPPPPVLTPQPLPAAPDEPPSDETMEDASPKDAAAAMLAAAPPIPPPPVALPVPAVPPLIAPPPVAPPPALVFDPAPAAPMPTADPEAETLPPTASATPPVAPPVPRADPVPAPAPPPIVAAAPPPVVAPPPVTPPPPVPLPVAAVAPPPPRAATPPPPVPAPIAAAATPARAATPPPPIPAPVASARSVTAPPPVRPAATPPPPTPVPVARTLPRKSPPKSSNLTLIIAGASVVFLALCLVTALVIRRSKTPPPAPIAAESPTPAAAESSPTANEPPSETVSLATVDPSAATAAAASAPPADSVQAPAALNLDAKADANQETRNDVLKRIDAMPLAQAKKDQLYKAVETAHHMGRIITIGFDSGRSDLSATAVANLKKTIARPDIQAIVNDPTVVIVILGFADSKGSAKINKETSDRRAEKTMTVLRDSCGLINVMHDIGMGGSEMLAKGNTEKNRVAEVWVVSP